MAIRLSDAAAADGEDADDASAAAAAGTESRCSRLDVVVVEAVGCMVVGNTVVVGGKCHGVVVAAAAGGTLVGNQFARGAGGSWDLRCTASVASALICARKRSRLQCRVREKLARVQRWKRGVIKAINFIQADVKKRF